MSESYYGDACAVILLGVCQYASLSSFHIILILPYLVLITLSLLSTDWLTDILFLLIFCSLFSSHFLWLLSSTLCDIECSCVVLFLCGPLYMLLLLLLATGCFSTCVKMFSSGSVLVCLCGWSWRYCQADISVGFTCCLFHVTSLPVFVMWMWYSLSWWFWLPFPFNCVMGPWSPIFLLNHFSRPYGKRHKIVGSNFVFVIFGLSFYYHFMMFFIII